VFSLLISSYVESGCIVHIFNSGGKGNDQSYIGDSRPAMPCPSNLHHSQWCVRIVVEHCAFRFVALWKLMLGNLCSAGARRSTTRPSNGA
jgi:hypothetical protein